MFPSMGMSLISKLGLLPQQAAVHCSMSFRHSLCSISLNVGG